jgi:predicted nucleic acid-binding protein
MIVADTGAIIALIDRSEDHHRVMRDLYEERPGDWVLPWAILPEVDYLLATHVGARAQEVFHEDLTEDNFNVEWGNDGDLEEAVSLVLAHKDLHMGLVDAVVMATAIRLKARAIATLDLRHFGAVSLPGNPRLYPRDLDASAPPRGTKRA